MSEPSKIQSGYRPIVFSGKAVGFPLTESIEWFSACLRISLKNTQEIAFVLRTIVLAVCLANGTAAYGQEMTREELKARQEHFCERLAEMGVSLLREKQTNPYYQLLFERLNNDVEQGTTTASTLRYMTTMIDLKTMPETQIEFEILSGEIYSRTYLHCIQAN